ncbi:DUF389 domain-containing protein [Verrucomicrobiaceae bacterium 5K15]|uniref:DUF389 domain-containing protein n=1 Tax=Oceaniferula flava TaxID=2800421 RepID=A0AAE2SCF9_9BACT|nr:DUF389 domain-containing protein [Oceaniferula flavus]MBK1855888.1 DUF389 domain-containing protein [Oceaniferula flavus]MBM1137195.1 DUF389 domain-containing protein [Oceaniferula flavus]
MLLIIRKHNEAAAMTRWGVRIARALDSPLNILWLEQGGSDQSATDLSWKPWGVDLLDEEAQWSHLADALIDCGTMEIKLCRVNCLSRHETALSVERSLTPDLIVVGRHDSARDGSMTGKLAREILDDAHCPVLVLRLGSFNIEENTAPSILVPCAGGSHSRLGLRLAAKMAGSEATAFYIESDTDELSADVGREHLRRAVQRAGVSEEEISSKVVLSDSISTALKAEVKSGQYGLLLIGATGGGTLRRKLFGTVPERLMKGDEGMSVGVIRAARPMGHRLREKMGQLLSLNVPQLERDERILLFTEIEGKARWSFDFAVLMILATAIAGLGLLADSAAVVIGAMLVAPLMTPLLGGGLAVVQGNWPLWRQCQKAVLLGFFSALLIGIGLGFGARSIGMGITGELLARGEPTLLDLGVAFISGIAASYCLARPKLSSALAGVAIAAALVPPIATTGICLALNEQDTAKGAGLLFGTNVVAIVLGSAMNFLIAGVRGKKDAAQLWAQRLAIVLALVCAGLTVPLASVLVSKAAKTNPIERSIAEVLVASDLPAAQDYRLLSTQFHRKKNQSGVMEIHLEGPGFPPPELAQSIQRAVEKSRGKGVKTRIRMSLIRDVSSIN